MLIAPHRALQLQRTHNLARPPQQQPQNRQFLSGQFERSIPAQERPIGLEPQVRKPIPKRPRIRGRRERIVHRNQRSSVESLQHASRNRDRFSRSIAGFSSQDSHRNHPGKAIHKCNKVELLLGSRNSAATATAVNGPNKLVDGLIMLPGSAQRTCLGSVFEAGSNPRLVTAPSMRLACARRSLSSRTMS